MAPSDKPASTAVKAPASKAPASKGAPACLLSLFLRWIPSHLVSLLAAPAGSAKKTTGAKKAAAPPVDGEKKKRRKTRKETYSSYIYKG